MSERSPINRRVSVGRPDVLRVLLTIFVAGLKLRNGKPGVWTGGIVKIGFSGRVVMVAGGTGGLGQAVTLAFP